MRQGWPAAFAGIALFLLIEAAVFRSGLYAAFVRPESYTGAFETAIRFERRLAPAAGPPRILAVGDSRMALRAWYANQLQSKYTFGNGGVASSNARAWSYLLRELDPRRSRYAAILFLLPDYEDADQLEDLANRPLDTRLLLHRLGLFDIPAYATSISHPPTRRDAVVQLLFKGAAYKQDLQDFLKSPSSRLADIADHEKMMTDVLSGYKGDDRTMDGVQIEWATRTATYPEHFTAEQRRYVQEILLSPPADPTGNHERYHRRWLGEILDAYANSSTRLIFCRVPRAPYLSPERRAVNPASFVRSLAGRRNVVLLEETLLEPLEKPAFFQDPFHLNADGCLRLTEILSRRVIDAL